MSEGDNNLDYLFINNCIIPFIPAFGMIGVLAVLWKLTGSSC